MVSIVDLKLWPPTCSCSACEGHHERLAVALQVVSIVDLKLWPPACTVCEGHLERIAVAVEVFAVVVKAVDAC